MKYQIDHHFWSSFQSVTNSRLYSTMFRAPTGWQEISAAEHDRPWKENNPKFFHSLNINWRFGKVLVKVKVEQKELKEKFDASLMDKHLWNFDVWGNCEKVPQPQDYRKAMNNIRSSVHYSLSWATGRMLKQPPKTSKLDFKCAAPS